MFVFILNRYMDQFTLPYPYPHHKPHPQNMESLLRIPTVAICRRTQDAASAWRCSAYIFPAV